MAKGREMSFLGLPFVWSDDFDGLAVWWLGGGERGGAVNYRTIHPLQSTGDNKYSKHKNKVFPICRLVDVLSFLQLIINKVFLGPHTTRKFSVILFTSAWTNSRQIKPCISRHCTHTTMVAASWLVISLVMAAYSLAGRNRRIFISWVRCCLYKYIDDKLHCGMIQPTVL